MDVTFDRSTSGEKRLHDDVSCDIEDMARQKLPLAPGHATPVVTKHTPTSSQKLSGRRENWRTILGPPPDKGTTHVGMILMWGVAYYITV